MTQPLNALVQAAFSDDGVLAHTCEAFRPRAGQTDMALAIANTLEEGGELVVEAGTGVGKTFAYLVPALLSGRRVLVSTASKTLQDQLFGRDLPQLLSALGLPLRTALLKGRGSYLCPHRLELARHGMSPGDAFGPRALARIELWAQGTRSGDLAELPGLDERSPLLPLITSTRENCLGSQCPQFRACHVNQARREALAADLVVINHHLFFADLAVRESGMAELLPTVDAVIFDEAHQLNETGIQFLGCQFSTAQWLDFTRDLLACGMEQARGLADWLGLAQRLEFGVRDLRLAVGRAQGGTRLRWVEEVPERVDAALWRAALGNMQAACAQTMEALTVVSGLAPDFERLHERAASQHERLQAFGAGCAEGAVRWLDVNASQVRLVESPLDIAQAVRERLLTSSSDEDRRKAWIFTSATLGDEPTLKWFTEPCGLEQARVLRVQSPFDYAHQAAVYVPRDLPAPNAPGHSEAIAGQVARWAPMIGGRTLVLTTSLRALRAIGEELQHRFAESGGPRVLVQGQSPKRQLMEWFRAPDTPAGCVLVASASFWEGFDVPGDALQLVVIDKLPFPSPGDPLVEARASRLRQDGRNPFNDYFVPEAAVALKQGAGRLIRRESDRGILVLCDTRLLSMSYGRRLLAALPPMRQVPDEAALLAALEALTTASTTVRPWGADPG